MAKKKTLTERVVELEMVLDSVRRWSDAEYASVESRLCKVERDQTLAFEASNRDVDARINNIKKELLMHEQEICCISPGHKWEILAIGGSVKRVCDISVCCIFCGIKKNLKTSQLTRRQKRDLRKSMKL